MMCLIYSCRRTRAIKELLSQSAPVLDTWKVAGLRGSLSIPQEWIDEAKVCARSLLSSVDS